MPFPAIPSQIRCPQCNTPFMVEVRTVVDVGQEPELKEQFLRGELNHARCPQCGTGGMLTTPLIYHDPGKSLLVAFVPPELGLSAQDQERTIGSLVNAVINDVPAEQRKGYMLQPKTVLTYNGLLELVLEGEGFSKEVLERQRNWITLINNLVGAMEDEAAFDRLVAEHSAEMSYEFFLMLSDLIDAQAEHSSDEGEVSLKRLRDRLLDSVTPGTQGATPTASTPGELVDLLIEAQDGPNWETIVERNLPRMDYGFFQELTRRLELAEASDDEGMAGTLSRLRQGLLNALERENQQMREAEDQASLLIMEMLDADDLDAAVRENEDQLDDVFFIVLARLRQTALSHQSEKRAQRLGALLDKARDVREEKLPPDMRLVSRLLRADYPEASGRLLNEESQLLNTELLGVYDRYIAQIGEGISDSARERLNQIRAQIASRVGDQPA